MSKKRVVVVCPGRGSYTKEQLGTLAKSTHIDMDLDFIDSERQKTGWPGLREMDAMEKFKTSLHTKGEHASPLIYACAKEDFLSIDQDRYEVVAIAGNSMGWYLTLAFAGCLSAQDSFELIQSMGAMMVEGLIGGQIIYPVIDENWQMRPDVIRLMDQLIQEINEMEECELYNSIFLGGYRVIAGNKKGLEEVTSHLEKVDNYPFQLVNHGAFHTPMLHDISESARHGLYNLEFQSPKVPIIDGRGHIWQPYSTDTKKLYDYTLINQVIEPYDFTSSITVALKEFAPDHVVLLGPGNSLGGSIGQILIQNQWHGVTDKNSFKAMQEKENFLLSMGVESQRSQLVK